MIILKIRKSLTLGVLALSLIMPVYAESTNVKIANNLLTNNVITPQGYDDESIYVTITYYASLGNLPEKIWHQEVRNGKVYSGYLKFTGDFTCSANYCHGTYSGNLYYAGPAF